MANFTEIHRQEFNEAARNLRERRSDIWNIALREPLRFDAMMSETVTVIQVVLGADRKLHPANEGSLAAIQEWKQRFESVAAEAFDFPTTAFAPALRSTPPADGNRT